MEYYCTKIGYVKLMAGVLVHKDFKDSKDFKTILRF